MARWRPGARSYDARVLTDRDLDEALVLCARAPVRSTLAAARLVEARTTGLRAARGVLWGYPAEGPLEAICWAGANLVPVVPDGVDVDRACAAFAALALRHGRRSSSVVGERDAVLALWDRLEPRWPAAREVRDDQPSLAIDGEPLVEPDPAVRRSVPDELGVVLPACVRMFVEEVGYSPVAAGGSAYEDRVRQLIRDGRSFVRREEVAGRPISFKAELGAVTPQVAQVQGVWVDPLFRGHGLSESGMAAVVRITRAEVAPVVSLYVNAYNERALRTYRRVGFEQVGTYATVLF
ncbi:hypothetical protein CLV28_2815 [Sediminihabitans luteus]|uniref:N-acetyltransferase domain-containing protein n=1 Tax=Sediminihabitans luteus TaxID=1138585 RepID=A0A2M9CCC7_9CELL|nr:DUF4081 domain-containing GNAT family N-acetyltransferase [Sediminihabitans luteus]PJJ69008.1 hypothetical protein CLV28_2815 [Sediminihabitans luteus]GII99392.1 N-acetyltransferase GCN5 [Sediminihabitans luteus]